MKLPRKLERFLTTPKRFKVVFGGRGATKSQSFAQIFLMKAQTERAKIMCLRELQNSISDSVLSLLREQIVAMELDGFTTTDAAIRHHGEDVFRFKGLARNPDAVKSAHGFKYAWVEEAQAISERSLRLLTPTLREAESELWFSLNPGSSADPMSQRFLQPFYEDLVNNKFYEDDQHLIAWVNYDDNPWFPPELEAERAWDEANLPRAVYDHVWLGMYNDEVENAIIPAEHFDAAIDAHKKLGWKGVGAKYVGYDPADTGPDSSALAYRHGSLVLDVTEWYKNDVNATCDWATGYALTVGAEYFCYDGDGLGASLRRQISQAFEGVPVDFQAFRGGLAVDYPGRSYDDKARGGRARTNKDIFKNARAQYYWQLRDRFHATYRAVTNGEYADPADLISLSSDIKHLDKLRSEICRIPLKPHPNGLIQIMPKDEMKRMGIPSPNLADALVYCFAAKPTINSKTAQNKINIPTIRPRRMSR